VVEVGFGNGRGETEEGNIAKMIANGGGGVGTVDGNVERWGEKFMIQDAREREPALFFCGVVLGVRA